MYNLLMTYAEGDWEKGTYTYDISRFLEYTPEDVSESFRLLNTDTIEKIKEFPCLFVYEAFEGSSKVGKIKSIQAKGRSLSIDFEFCKDTPEIDSDTMMDIASNLNVRGWETNRTHWAIKKVDLFATLKDSGIITDTPSLFKKSKHIADNAKLATKKSDSIKQSTVKSVSEFIEKVSQSVAKQDDAEVFYRGHSDKKRYKLEPSLFRKDPDGNYTHLHGENILYRELIVSNNADFSSDSYTLDKLVRMQHYSLPTRLLDITSNPLIALYFACKNKPEEEGEVIIFTLSRENVKYFDSDTASCVANLARLPMSEKTKIDFNKESIGEFNDQMPIKRLTHFIREEKSFFEERIAPGDLRRVICIKSKKSNDRISSQSGAFFLFGIDAILDEKGSPEIKISRISIKNKIGILQELDMLNINESTVFPNIENSAKYIADKYKYKAPKDDFWNLDL
ncbi:FRG domain-containing protein [Chromobacterium violaceum]